MTMTGLTIPFNGLKKQYNTLRTEILDTTDMVLRSGGLMNGNYTAEFENWLAKKNHSKYAVTCHSGTQALQIIAEFVKNDLFEHEQQIAIPNLTYPATVNAFVKAGYRPHQIKLVDVDNYGIIKINDINPDADTIVVAVGLYGASINQLHNYNKFLIIEDAAQHWLADNCTRLGSASAVSFDPTKNLSNYGNGGAIITDNLSLAEYARLWRANGRPDHVCTGTNSRMSEIDCAGMLIKTKYLDSWQERRKKIARHWIEIFSKHHIRCLIDDSNLKNHGFQKFVIDIDHRNTVADKLAIRKIETKIHYEKPLNELPVYALYPARDTFISNAASLSRRVLSLPFYPELTDLEVEYIADQVIGTKK
jgi:dTDP-4-amino-4,6-dideoxygalactose transaminase